MKARRVFLLGWYGMQNAGDDALLLATSALCNMHCPDVTLRIVVPSMAVLPTLPSNIEVVYFPQRRVPGQTLMALMRNALACRAVMFGGGSMFLDTTPARRRSVVGLGVVVLVARMLRKPVYMLGVSVGPTVTFLGRLAVGVTMRVASAIGVRDARSAHVCGQMGVGAISGADIGMVLPSLFGIERVASVSTVSRVGVFLSNALCECSAQKDRRIKRLAEVLRQVASRIEIAVEVFDLCGHAVFGDRALSVGLVEEIGDACEARHIPYTGDVEALLRDIAALDLVIAERFHAAVFGCSLGVPCIVLEHEQKGRDLSHDLGLPVIFGATVVADAEQVVATIKSGSIPSDGSGRSGNEKALAMSRNVLHALGVSVSQ